MIKSILLICLCGVLLIEAQSPPPSPRQPGTKAHHRMVRQQPPGAVAGIPEGMKGGGNPGNLAMQGMGNIPDPTVLIAKGQEIASQFAKGARRLLSIPKMPEMPKIPTAN